MADGGVSVVIPLAMGLTEVAHIAEIATGAGTILLGSATMLLAIATKRLVGVTKDLVRESKFARRQSGRPLLYLRIVPNSAPPGTTLPPRESGVHYAKLRVKNVGFGPALFPTLVVIAKRDGTPSDRVESIMRVMRDGDSKWGRERVVWTIEPISGNETLKYWVELKFPAETTMMSYRFKIFYMDAYGVCGSVEVDEFGKDRLYTIPGDDETSVSLSLSSELNVEAPKTPLSVSDESPETGAKA
jgi:hypothetical protein